MKLTAAELTHVCSQGLYITEKCDACPKLLNQTRRYTIAGRQEVYCSAVCRDPAFFGDLCQARRHSAPGKCIYCGGSLKGKKRGSLFCDDTCRKAYSRKIDRMTTAGVEKSRTPAQLNQGVADARIAGQSNCIADALQHTRIRQIRGTGRIGDADLGKPR